MAVAFIVFSLRNGYGSLIVTATSKSAEAAHPPLRGCQLTSRTPHPPSRVWPSSGTGDSAQAATALSIGTAPSASAPAPRRVLTAVATATCGFPAHIPHAAKRWHSFKEPTLYAFLFL